MSGVNSGTDILVCVYRLKPAQKFTDRNVCATEYFIFSILLFQQNLTSTFLLSKGISIAALRVSLKSSIFATGMEHICAIIDRP
ncbi:MAG: hypothetical protein EAZ92_08950 [Candidatus Kapaibacterium sp.]|nr:MAG: hypothetical protein EAZ92_08950 [Candidatus Kapabacteria bacterium]